jgi:hypothetical protein
MQLTSLEAISDLAYSIGEAFIEVDDDPMLRWQFPIELRTLEISVLDRLTEDPRVNAKAAAEVVIVAPSTMATGSFIVCCVVLKAV